MLSAARSLMVVLVILLAVVAGARSGWADPGEVRPILTLDTGMHTAPIRGIAADRSCTLVATASEDKTVRLWRMPDGRLLNTIRLPIGPGNNGKLFAVAVAPDAGWIATGGWTVTGGEHYVYVLQAATGAVAARFGPFREVVSRLAVSADGRYLAAGLRHGQGLRVWQRVGADLSSWQMVREDRNYSGRDVTGIAIHGDKLVTVAQDHKIRRYEITGKKPPLFATTSGRLPASVSVSDAGQLAVGYSGTAAIDIYDAGALTRVRRIETAGADAGSLQTVAWVGSSGHLAAAGSHQRDGRYLMRSWKAQGDGFEEAEVSSDAVLAMAGCGSGVLVAAADPAFGLFDADGKRTLWRDRVTVDMRDKLGDAFAVSPDGMRVRFGLSRGGADPVVFDLASEELGDAPAETTELLAARTSGLAVTDWQSNKSPKLDGRALVLAEHDRSQSLAISPAGDRFVLGTDFQIRAYDREGRELWREQAPGGVWGVNIARDRGVVVVACGDGTIRWYDLELGRPLVALFVRPSDRRWVAWTPSGYFTASAGGENLIGWHVNRTLRDSADYFPMAKFRDQFYRPDIVKRILLTSNEESAIKEADAAARLVHKPTSVAKSQPPVVKLLSPTDRSTFASNSVSVAYVLRSPSGEPVTRVVGLVDGAVAATVDLKDAGRVGSGSASLEMTLPVPPRDVTIALVAETATKSSTPAKVNLIRVGAAEPTQAKPNAFAVVVGIGDYSGDLTPLPFAANDAAAFADQLEDQRGRAYNEVTIKRLIDRRVAGEEATALNIKKALSWLRQQARDPDDVAIVYFSGHGKSIPGATSYLLPIDYDGNHDLTAIDKPSMFSMLKQVNAKLILFIDACHGAGSMDTIDLVNDTAAWETVRVITFASSKRSELSYGSGNQSFFTQALLEGIGGVARHAGNAVQTDDLQLYLGQRVRALASPKKQTPIATMSPSWEHFVLARTQ